MARLFCDSFLPYQVSHTSRYEASGFALYPPCRLGFLPRTLDKTIMVITPPSAIIKLSKSLLVVFGEICRIGFFFIASFWTDIHRLAFFLGRKTKCITPSSFPFSFLHSLSLRPGYYFHVPFGLPGLFSLFSPVVLLPSPPDPGAGPQFSALTFKKAVSNA